jgi:hypothetical protein
MISDLAGVSRKRREEVCRYRVNWAPSVDLIKRSRGRRRDGLRGGGEVGGETRILIAAFSSSLGSNYNEQDNGRGWRSSFPGNPERRAFRSFPTRECTFVKKS